MAAIQVLIRWALQHGTSVSPKAGSHEHVAVRLLWLSLEGHCCA
jgi:diketogulonate reductase-like aldo/keto reductase